jgi:uroporphyrinogen-III synthase
MIVLLKRVGLDAAEDRFSSMMPGAECISPIICIPSTKDAPDIQDCSAIVCTSAEAADRIKDCWKNEHLPCFCLGKGTAIAAERSGICDIRVFDEVKDAYDLADHVADWLDGDKNRKRKVVFPASNIRRNALVERLNERNVKVVEWIAYQTIPDPLLEHKLENVKFEKGKLNWVVFFSPSGVNAVIGTKFGKLWIDHPEIKIAAIGNTTAKSLKENGFNVHSVAKLPNPEDLYSAIQEYQNSCNY